jgi:nucleoside-diphosphate-sugar epimerase
MIKIAITGERGFLGRHLASYFSDNAKYLIISLGRNFLESIDKIKDADYLIHAASVHRRDNPDSVYRENMEMNYALIEKLNYFSIKINIVFISSVHEILDTPYGRSKIHGKAIFEKYCYEVNKIFISHSLPNLFGPYAKPNATSFIATFCYNLYNNLESSYNNNIVNLCYVNDAVAEIGKLSQMNTSFETIKIKVSDVFKLLKHFKNEIDIGNIPKVNSRFEQNLLYTFLSYKSFYK